MTRGLAALRSAPGSEGSVPPQLVQYNDWRQLEVPGRDAFTPVLPVSVIVSYYAQPEELARTLAALEGQTYPRELIEVVVVDDGSPTPLECPESTPLDVKVVRQEDLGFRLAASRNTGVRAAAHEVLVFMDSDTMPEAEFVAAHARWHHVVPDALTLGVHAHVPVDGVDPDMIRNRSGTLAELLSGRPVDLNVPRWIAAVLKRTDDLTAKVDDFFGLVTGGNLGLRRAFFDRVGGFDESFTQWGGEDTEFGWRAYVQGGLLIPVGEAYSWHQGSWEDDREEKEQLRHLQQPRIAHLIAHPARRTGLAGRSFLVPQTVVTIRGGALDEQALLKSVERVLAGWMHDLVVRLELPDGHPGREWLRRALGPDQRVRVGPSRSALEDFPASRFHITLPAEIQLHADVVHRMQVALGDAVAGHAEFADGSRASITRAWALHRAQHTPWQISDFGDVVTLSARKLLPPPVPVPVPISAAPADDGKWARLRGHLRRVKSPAAAWRFVNWLGYAVLWRVRRKLRAAWPRRQPGAPQTAPDVPEVAPDPPLPEARRGAAAAVCDARANARIRRPSRVS